MRALSSRVDESYVLAGFGIAGGLPPSGRREFGWCGPTQRGRWLCGGAAFSGQVDYSGTVCALFAAGPGFGAVFFYKPASAYFGLDAVQGLVRECESNGDYMLSESCGDLFRC